MLIRIRDPRLSCTSEIFDEKALLTLEWLDEFHVSSRTVLANRLGMSASTASRFFISARKRELIGPIKNPHLPGMVLIRTLPGGRDLLRYHGVSPQQVPRLDRLMRTPYLRHDLAVQAAIERRLDAYVEVEWDRRIRWVADRKRPDAVLITETGKRVALEYERSRKTPRRIHAELISHAKLIEDGRVNAVVYVFESSSDRDLYQKVFDEPLWIGVGASDVYDPDMAGVRGRFGFKVEEP